MACEFLVAECVKPSITLAADGADAQGVYGVETYFGFTGFF